MSGTGMAGAIGGRVGGFLVLAAFAAALLAVTDRAAVEPPVLLPAGSEIEPVVQQEARAYREWTGRLGGYLVVEIRPQAGGSLLRRLYREGSFVRKGDPLFEIEYRVPAPAAAPAGGQGRTRIVSPIDGIAGIARARSGDAIDARTVLTTVSTVDWIKVHFQASREDYAAWTRRPEPPDRWPAGHPRHQALFELFPVAGAPYAHPGHLLPAGRGAERAGGAIALVAVFPNPDHLLVPGGHALLRAPVDAGGTRTEVIEARLMPVDRLASGGAWSGR